jgi:3'-5' exonuclease
MDTPAQVTTKSALQWGTVSQAHLPLDHLHWGFNRSLGGWSLDGARARCSPCWKAPRESADSAFVDWIAELSPQLVTFNGSSFDLPVLRYRALVRGVTTPGLSARPYFNRSTEDAVDLCDVLSSFNSQGKVTLHELCRVMGLPGKPDGISGADVERYFREGRIREIADYCESDVVNNYRVWLRYELFRGRLSGPEFEASEAELVDFIKARGNTKPHLTDLT